jgi:hypothetical protein
VSEKKTNATKQASAKSVKRKLSARADSDPSLDVMAPQPSKQAVRDRKPRPIELTSDLPRLESIDQAPVKLMKLQAELDAERAEHNRWRELLKELGDSPEAIVKNWHGLKNRHSVPLEQTFQIAPPAMDERVFRARLVSRGIKKAGEQLNEIERLDPRYADLFTGTGLEFHALAFQLGNAATSLETTLNLRLTEQVRFLTSELPQRERMDEVLKAFLRQLLTHDYLALLSMLRLWQVMEVYFCDSEDSLVATLHTQSKEYRRTCVQILSDLDCLGVHFHNIRFLEDPHKAGLVFTEAPSLPPLQNNQILFAAIRNALHSNAASNYWKTTADVALWGVECNLHPVLNCQTQLWLWRSSSL